jgi:tRNA(Leu) C34 or U34 (ribose-2'-O)-methylase TrmL
VTGYGVTPAMLLIDPKYPDNVGRTVRTCACLGVSQLWYTGTRCRSQWELMRRLPREERLGRYSHTALLQADEHRPLAVFGPQAVPVAVEVVPGAQDITWFTHPEGAVYVFGPEDGTLSAGILSACHQFLVLPSDGSPLNLSVAVGWVLGDRRAQRIRAGLEPPRADGERARPVVR